jgi:hypothetical protein
MIIIKKCNLCTRIKVLPMFPVRTKGGLLLLCLSLKSFDYHYVGIIFNSSLNSSGILTFTVPMVKPQLMD